MSLGPSKNFGEYSLATAFAQGSMGLVYSATHRPTGEPVLVKVPLDDSLAQRDALEREIRALSALDHPGIVRLLDHGNLEGIPWLAQPRVRGDTLQAVFAVSQSQQRGGEESSAPPTFGTIPLDAPPPSSLEGDTPPSSRRPSERARARAPLTFNQVRDLAEALLDALEHMHAAGIVHGDLKPENIIIDRRDQPVLIDFGTSIRVDHFRDALHSAPKTVGTAAYMAPERLLSRGFDARADYYSLGCLLYEAISGVSPFARSSLAATVLAQLRFHAPTLQSLDCGAPRHFSQIVARLLSKSADERPEYASEIREALHAGTQPVRRAPPHNNILRRPELVGRDAQLALLREKIIAARDGKGEHLRLVGPSGSGKTRLAIAAADLADKAGFDVIEISRESSDQLVPLELSTLWERCRKRPVLLVVDHFEAVDSTSLEFLRALSAASLSGRPLLTLWTENPRLPLAPDEVYDIALPALARKQTARIAHDALGIDRLSTQVQGRLYEVSGGNPGHLLRYLRALIDERALVRRDYEGWHWSNATHPLLSSASVERTVRATFESHLHRVPVSVREPARVAAILGRTFRFSEFLTLSKLSETEATRYLALLIQEHVVESTFDDRFRFVHPEYQALLRDECAPDQKIEYHRKAAQLLAPLVEERPDLAFSVAEHLFESGEWQQAADFFQLAAKRYSRVQEREVAADLLNRANDALLRLPRTSKTLAELRALDEKLGDVYLGLRRLDDAAKSFQAALDRNGPPVVAARILRKLSSAHDRDKKQALEDLQEAIELLRGPWESGSEEQIEWIECHLAAMFIHYWRQETGRVLAIAEIVKPHVQKVGTPEQLASYHFNLAAGLLLHHKYVARKDEVEHSEKAVELYEKVGDQPRVAMSRFMRSLILLCARKLDEADAGFSNILAAAEETASVTIQLRALTYLCLVARMKGEVERVRRMASSALSLAREHQMQEYAGTALANLSWVALCDGGREKCLHFAQEALSAWKTAPVVSPFTWTARLPWLAAQIDQHGALLEDTATIIEWTAPLLLETQQRPPSQVQMAAEDLVECALAPDADVGARTRELIEAAKGVGWL